MSTHKKYYNNGSKPSGYTPQNSTPKKKQYKKDWTYWLVVIALAFTFIGSILGTVSFAKGCIEDYHQKNALSSIHSVEDIAKYKSEKPFINSAFDTVTEDYTYYGNNFFVPTQLFDSDGNPIQFTATNFLSVDSIITTYPTQDADYVSNGVSRLPKFSLSIVSNKRDKPLGIYDNITNTYYFPDESGYFTFSVPTRYTTTAVPNPSYVDGNTYLLYYSDHTMGTGYSNCYGKLYVSWQYGFNANVQRITFSSSSYDYDTDYTRISNRVNFYDNNNYFFSLSFTVVVADNPNVVGKTSFEYRQYYLNTEIADSIAYQNGYQQGYNNGEIVGKQDGYNDGYQDGKVDGYNQGYNVGVESSNEFTFLGLFGALFDAPITALQGLLNFNLLGFNMFNFFTALLTIGLIIFVVRLFV